MLTIHGVPISVHTRKVLVTAIEKQLQYRNEPVIPFTPAGRLERPLSDAQDPGAHRRRSRPPRFLGDLRLPGAHAPDARALSGRDARLRRGALVRGIRRRHDLSRGRARALRPEDHSPEHPEAGDRRRRRSRRFSTPRCRRSSATWRARSTAISSAAGQFTIADIAIVSNLINFHYLGYRLDGDIRSSAAISKSTDRAAIDPGPRCSRRVP